MTTQYGQNAFAPGASSSEFLPDQLIAGQLQPVTKTATISGGKYVRGTILAYLSASRKYTVCVYSTDATDGSNKPCAILVDDVDASTEDKQGGIYLMGEFNQNKVTYDSSWDGQAAVLFKALEDIKIFLRDPISAQ